MRVLATIAFSFAAGLFLVLLLPWSGWYLWAAAGLALAALGLSLLRAAVRPMAGMPAQGGREMKFNQIARLC